MKMKKRRNNFGFTVVEVLIFSAVALVLLGILTQFFVLAMKRTEDSRLKVDLQQSAVMILRQFSSDLNSTSSKAIRTLDGEPYVVAITPVLRWGAGSETPAVWYKRQLVWIFDPTERTLVRDFYQAEEEPFDPPPYSEPLADFRHALPSVGELQSLANNSSVKRRKLSSDVEEFSLTNVESTPTSPKSRPLMKLDMKLRRPLTSSERFAEFTVERRFALRNSF